MAHVANEMSVRLHQTSSPAIEKAGDVAAILTSLEAGDVLFIDDSPFGAGDRRNLVPPRARTGASI
jgi:hypothetical protein